MRIENDTEPTCSRHEVPQECQGQADSFVKISTVDKAEANIAELENADADIAIPADYSTGAAQYREHAIAAQGGRAVHADDGAEVVADSADVPTDCTGATLHERFIRDTTACGRPSVGVQHPPPPLVDRSRQYSARPNQSGTSPEQQARVERVQALLNKSAAIANRTHVPAIGDYGSEWKAVLDTQSGSW